MDQILHDHLMFYCGIQANTLNQGEADNVHSKTTSSNLENDIKLSNTVNDEGKDNGNLSLNSNMYHSIIKQSMRLLITDSKLLNVENKYDYTLLNSRKTKQ